MEAQVRQRIEKIDSEIDALKRKGEEDARQKIHQSSLEEMRVKKKRKRSERAAKRKSKTQQDGMTSKEQEAELMAQKQLADQMCMQADAHFFGFAPNANRKEALRLYEESESYANSKAMLALGSIYEKGLINEKSERGGITSMGALE